MDNNIVVSSKETGSSSTASEIVRPPYLPKIDTRRKPSSWQVERDLIDEFPYHYKSPDTQTFKERQIIIGGVGAEFKEIFNSRNLIFLGLSREIWYQQNYGNLIGKPDEATQKRFSLGKPFFKEESRIHVYKPYSLDCTPTVIQNPPQFE